MTNLHAIHKLASQPQDADALLTLYDNIRELIHSAIAVHFGDTEEGREAHYIVLYRIARRARDYDDASSLADWLIETADTECVRIQNERKLVA